MSRLILALLIAALGATWAGADNSGFIYGTVTLLEGEQHTGFIRWGVEEAFWDDLFHSRQVANPWLDHVDVKELQAERRRRYFETHGMLDRIMWTLHNKDDELKLTRLYISRFGFIDESRVDEDEEVTLLVSDGLEVPVRGYANDVTSDL